MPNEGRMQGLSKFAIDTIRDPLRARRHLHDYRFRRERDLIRDLQIFAPGSAGHARDLARLTIQSATQTFPFMTKVIEAAGCRLATPVSAQEFCNRLRGEERARELGALLDKYGSDKVRQEYHLVYGAILAERGGSAPFAEVGIGTNNEDVPSNMGRAGKPGASLRAFRDFLPEAHVIGADIDKRILFTENRIDTVWVDQTDLNSFAELGKRARGFRLLIDDGLHSPNANLAVLQFGLLHLEPGSWVIIEDIVPAVLPLWQVVAATVPPQFDCHLIRTRTALMFGVTRATA